ncbi:helix-turn-helix domain-containing protein [Lachnospiraceae bacterium LCP25S3_G4]
MPRVKPTKNQEDKRKVQGIIIGKLVEKGIGKKDLSTKCNFTIQSFYNKYNNPNSFTLGELKVIVKTLGISKDQLCNIFYDD